MNENVEVRFSRLERAILTYSAANYSSGGLQSVK
jgi:hypothetical protein